MHKNSLDNNIDQMKNTVLKRLIDEKNELICELEQQNQKLKRSIIDIEAKNKTQHRQIVSLVEALQTAQNRISELERSTDRNIDRNTDRIDRVTTRVPSADDISMYLRSEFDERPVTKRGSIDATQKIAEKTDESSNNDRISNEINREINSVRRDFLDMMRMMSMNSSHGHTVGHPVTHAVYPQHHSGVYPPYVQPSPHVSPVHFTGVPLNTGHVQYPPNYVQGTVPHTVQSVPMAPSHVFGTSSFPSYHNSTGDQNHLHNSHNHNAHNAHNSHSTNHVDNSVDNTGVISVKGMFKNRTSSDLSNSSIPHPPPAPPLTTDIGSGGVLKSGSGSSINQHNVKGGMDMVIDELKNLIKKREQKQQVI